jgi:predicted SAM-dependent methyltransferase
MLRDSRYVRAIRTRLEELLGIERRLSRVEGELGAAIERVVKLEQDLGAERNSRAEHAKEQSGWLSSERIQREEELRKEYQGRVDGEQVLVKQIDALRGQLDSVRSGLAEGTARVEWLVKWVESFRQELFLEVKLRLDDQSRLIEPTVVARESYDAKVRASPDGIKLNLGSASRELEAHINVDSRAVSGVDLRADVRHLPFSEHQLTEIHASHLVEHFGDYEARKRLLPYWRSLLKEGGRIVVIVPDAEAMMKRWAAGEFPWEDLREVTFGGQEYSGNTHYTMYTPDSLEQALKEAGFSRVERVAVGRRNGKCLEMELVAYR